MKEITQYSSLFLETEEGLIATDRTKFFVPLAGIDDEGNILAASGGNQLVEKESGFTFIVDNHIPDQLEKLKIDFSQGKPKIFLKEGEVLNYNKSLEEVELDELRMELQRKEAALSVKNSPMTPNEN